MPNIPNEYHFIWGLTPSPHGKPFIMIHYIAIASCYYVNKPRRINFYYIYEPSGFWWKKARPFVNPIPISEVICDSYKNVRRADHLADVLRLQVLLSKGGVYLDLDVLSIRPFTDLLDAHVVLGREHDAGICNAVILAEPQSRFINVWLDSYDTFDDNDWQEHSVRIPQRLCSSMSEVKLLDYRKFFWPRYGLGDDLRKFLLYEGSHFCSESYCVHLWESATWEFLHELTPADLWATNSEFFLLARQYVDNA